MVFSLLKGFFKTYRTATAVCLLSKPERILWDIVFLILLISFVIGLYKLTINSYKSFIRVFFDAAEILTHSGEIQKDKKLK